MHVDYEISERDYLDGQRLAIKNSSVRIVRWMPFVLPCFGALGVVFLIHGMLTQGFSVSVLPGMVFALFFLSIPLWSKRAFRKLITHEKVLVDCEPEFDEFIERIHLLADKLGPMLLQFPKFDKWVLKSSDEFRARLQSFFKRAADLNAGRFAVEVRNKDWLDTRLTDLLRMPC